MNKRTFCILLIFGICTANCLRAAENSSPQKLDDASITVKFSEIRSLWEAAKTGQEGEIIKPPVNAVLSKASYWATLKNESVEIQGRFIIENFSETWTEIPVFPSNMQLERIEPATTQLFVKNGYYTFFTNKKGSAEFLVGFRVKPRKQNGSEGGQLQISNALINEVIIASNSEDRNLILKDFAPSKDAQNEIAYYVPAGETVQFLISRKQQQQEIIPSRWATRIFSLAKIEEGNIRYDDRIDLRTNAGSGVKAEFALPLRARITAVRGIDMESWSVAKMDDTQQKLSILWTTPDILERTIEIEHEGAVPFAMEKWQLNELSILEGESQGRTFVIETVEGLEFFGEGIRSLSYENELPDWITQQIGESRFIILENLSEFNVRRLPRVETTAAIVERAKFGMRVVDDGGLLNNADYLIRNDEPLTWKIYLPKKSDLLEFQVNGKSVKPVDRGENTLEVELPAQKEGKGNQVHFSYSSRQEPLNPIEGSLLIGTPTTDLFIHQLDWGLEIPSVYETAAIEGNVTIQPSTKGIQLQKYFCKGDQPKITLFYRKRGL